jgi:hypothetical protein
VSTGVCTSLSVSHSLMPVLHAPRKPRAREGVDHYLVIERSGALADFGYAPP